jgi:hypothetical protein
MAGMKPTKPKQSAARRRQASGDDECDLRFRTDLMGVRTMAAESIKPGDSLEVVLLREGGMRSVVCQTRAHEVVGALSAFPGLAQLIACIEGGTQYAALVEKSSARSCTVFVSRAKL